MVLAVGVWSVETLSGYLWFAFLGAALTAVVVHLLAGLGGGAATPGRIVIAGAAVTAALTSWTTALLLTDHERFDRLRFWMVGLGTGYDALAAVGPTMLAGIVLGLLGIRLLDTLALGDDLARSLGRNVLRDRAGAGHRRRDLPGVSLPNPLASPDIIGVALWAAGCAVVMAAVVRRASGSGNSSWSVSVPRSPCRRSSSTSSSAPTSTTRTSRCGG